MSGPMKQEPRQVGALLGVLPCVHGDRALGKVERLWYSHACTETGDDLRNAILNITWLIRQALESHPESKELSDALEITIGLAQESGSTIMKAIPHIKALIPGDVPDRYLLIKALKQAQQYAQEERECASTELHFVGVK